MRAFKNHYIKCTVTSPIASLYRSGASSMLDWCNCDHTRRQEEDGVECLMTILVTIIRCTRYIGYNIKTRRLQTDTDPCQIAAGSGGPEPECQIRTGCEEKRMRKPGDGSMTNLDLNVDRLKRTLTINSNSRTT